MADAKKMNNESIESTQSIETNIKLTTKPSKSSKPDKPKRKKKRANRTSYKDWLSEDKLLLIEGWARDGLRDEQIAHNIGIRRETLWDWKKKHDNISNSLKKGKEVVDFLVENALLKNALGFKYEENVVTRDGEIINVEKVQAPNTVAQIFWLKNRKPAKWRDRIESKQEVNIQQAPANDAILGALLQREIEE